MDCRKKSNRLDYAKQTVGHMPTWQLKSVRGYSVLEGRERIIAGLVFCEKERHHVCVQLALRLKRDLKALVRESSGNILNTPCEHLFEACWFIWRMYSFEAETGQGHAHFLF